MIALLALACSRLVNHVFIIGIDGAGLALVNLSLPNMNRISGSGMISYGGRAVFPSKSGQNWATMLHSVSPDVHKVNNQNSNRKKFSDNTNYPSILKLLRMNQPNAKIASIVNWNNINKGIIEDGAEAVKYNGNDDMITAVTAAYIKTARPDFVFVHLDEVDSFGHGYTFFSDRHKQAIVRADQRLGIILDSIEESGMMDDSLIIVSTDHGGSGEAAYDHGSNHPLDMNIFMAARAPFIPADSVVEEFNIGDIAAIASYGLGLQAPCAWTGKVPQAFLTAGEPLSCVEIPTKPITTYIIIGCVCGVALIAIIAVTVTVIVLRRRKLSRLVDNNPLSDENNGK